jgi:hypothetical protein
MVANEIGHVCLGTQEVGRNLGSCVTPRLACL